MWHILEPSNVLVYSMLLRTWHEIAYRNLFTSQLDVTVIIHITYLPKRAQGTRSAIPPHPMHSLIRFVSTWNVNRHLPLHAIKLVRSGASYWDFKQIAIKPCAEWKWTSKSWDQHKLISIINMYSKSKYLTWKNVDCRYSVSVFLFFRFMEWSRTYSYESIPYNRFEPISFPVETWAWESWKWHKMQLSYSRFSKIYIFLGNTCQNWVPV